MKNKVIKLTESDLINLVKNIISSNSLNETIPDYFHDLKMNKNKRLKYQEPKSTSPEGEIKYDELSPDESKIMRIRARLISIYDKYLDQIKDLEFSNEPDKDKRIDVINKKIDDIKELMRDEDAILNINDTFAPKKEYQPQKGPQLDRAIQKKADMSKKDLENKFKQNKEIIDALKSQIRSVRWSDDFEGKDKKLTSIVGKLKRLEKANHEINARLERNPGFEDPA